MAVVLRKVDEAEAVWRAAFQRWLERARPVDIICHLDRHLYPDPYTGEIETEARPGRQGRPGVTLLHANCAREIEGERCGTRITKVLGQGGILEYSRLKHYEWEDQYVIPREALEHGHLSKRQRGELRLYAIEDARRRKAEAAKAERRAVQRQRRAGPERAVQSGRRLKRGKPPGEKAAG